MTMKRLGERRTVPVQRIVQQGYRRPMREVLKVNKSRLEVCRACDGAFLHYRACPYFTGTDDLKIRLEAARAAKARTWA